MDHKAGCPAILPYGNGPEDCGCGQKIPNYFKAQFETWCPKGLKEPTAVIVLVPGSNGDGRGDIHDRRWVKFAQEHGCALVGCCFMDFKPAQEEDYCKVSLGSGQALVDFLNQSGYKGIKLLLWGHSAGGQFNYEFNAWYPEIVMGFVVNKGGVYFTHLVKPEARKTPGLFFVGKKDSEWRQYSVLGLWAINSAFGSKWDLYEEDCGHGEGQSVKLSMEFFHDLLSEGEV